MAEKRMFSKKITDSDAFIELSSAAQALYFHLNQGADDDGFNNQIQMAMYKSHASVDDLKVLLAKNFIIRFESGVIVIKHWRMHNTLRKDRYVPTNFQEELNSLGIKENGTYTLNNDGCQVVAKWLPDGCRSIDKNSIDKYSIDKNSIDKSNKEKKNDSCVDGSLSNDSCDNNLAVVVDFYNNNIGMITPFGLAIFEDYLKQMPVDLIILAMQKSVEADVRTIKYIKGILNNWSKKGIKTVLEAEKEDEHFKNAKENKEKHDSKYDNRFKNYEQREYEDLNNYYDN